MIMDSNERTSVDWGKINRAILARWSPAGLRRIKELAHNGRCFSA